jgi:hypothetical protein
MSSISSKTCIAMLAALGVLVAASSAYATTLNGDWAPFNRCPVDNPAMLSADGNNRIALCLASDSPNGSIKLGHVTVATGDTNLQSGLVANNTTGIFSLVPPVGGAIVSAPVHTPGGLVALMCPSSSPPASSICKVVTKNPSLNDVVATVRAAGAPSNFNLNAGLSAGQPLLTLPVKVQLRNPLLGGNCYIGSNANPIVLHPENLTSPTFGSQSFDANGTTDPNGVMGEFVLSGETQGDSSFAVPAATGCGPGGVADATINSRLGLPSPSGNNNLVLNNATTYLTGLNDPSSVAPNDGHILAGYWHAARLP